MAGSKKGERRGNAKPGSTKRQTIKALKGPLPTKRSHHRPHTRTEDYMRLIVSVMNGLTAQRRRRPQEAAGNDAGGAAVLHKEALRHAKGSR
jgi:hypothetical protein